MQVIIGVIGRSLSSFFYLGLLILIFVFIYSLMGTQLFGGIYDNFPGGAPRTNYDSFSAAMLTTFQVLTVENWHAILYPMVAQAGWSAAIYLISWIFLGNYVLLNLFLAILLDSFVEEDEEEKKEQQEQDQLNGLTDQPNNEDSKQNEIKGKRGDELLDAIEYQVKIEQGHQSNSSNFKKFVKKSKKKKDEAANVLDESIEINNETLVKKQTEVKPDFFIVWTSIIDLAFNSINLPVIKILRLLRTIRPLRFISHNSGIKIIVEALLQSLGHIFKLLLLYHWYILCSQFWE